MHSYTPVPLTIGLIQGAIEVSGLNIEVSGLNVLLRQQKYHHLSRSSDHIG